MSKTKKEERRESILQAARLVFEEQGYEKAKVSDIAAKVGVVEGTIFHHFDNKQKLVIKVMERFYNQITDELRQGLESIKGTRNRLHYIISFHLQTFVKNAQLCRVILSESRRGVQSELITDIQQFNRAYTFSLHQVVKEGIASGDIRPGTSTSLLNTTIYGSIELRLWLQLIDGQAIDLEKNANELTELIFRGIAQPKESIARKEVERLIEQLQGLL